MTGGWRTTPRATQITSQAANLTTSKGTQLASGSSAFTKGAWTQLVASLAADCTTVMILSGQGNGAGHQLAIDLGFGASGSEVAIINNLNFSNPALMACAYQFPLSFPAGTRLAGRYSSNSASDLIYPQVITTADTYMSAGQGNAVDTYGFLTATNLGTAVDPGTPVNTKGSYVTIVASTTADLAGLVLCVDNQNNSTGTSVVVNWLIDIAYGAAGSEVVVVPNYFVTAWMAPTSSGMAQMISPFIPVQIPAGVRLAARAQASNATLGNRVIGITLYGARL